MKGTSLPRPLPGSRRTALTLGIAGLVLSTGTACNFRKPLPRVPDAGPPVEVVGPSGQTPPEPAGKSPGRNAGLLTTDEHEPNDDRAHAQPIAPISGGIVVHGSLLPPTSGSAGKGDDDYYLYKVGGAAAPPPDSASKPAAVFLYIEASPGGSATRGGDLSLEITDAEGRPLAQSDERGRGESERVSGLAVLQGQLLGVRVRGKLPTGAEAGTATEQAAAARYELALTEKPAASGSELEPNNLAEQATPVSGLVANGALMSRRDEDYFLFTLPAGPGPLSKKPPAPGGLRAPAILRVELTSPGVTPTLRIAIGTGTDPATADPTPPVVVSPDGGAGEAVSFGPVLDVAAEKGAQELKLANLGLPKGAKQVRVSVAGLHVPRDGGRYQLKLAVDPEPEGGEREPNNDCATATAIELGKREGGGEGGSIAGFLWPGDVDCFKVTAGEGGEARKYRARLALPSSSCQATLSGQLRDGSKVAAAADGSVELGGAGEVYFKVASKDLHSCFQDAYRLTVETLPKGSRAPAPE